MVCMGTNEIYVDYLKRVLRRNKWRLCRVREELNMKICGGCADYDNECYMLLNRTVWIMQLKPRYVSKILTINTIPDISILDLFLCYIIWQIPENRL